MPDHTSHQEQLQLPFAKLCECGCGQPAPIATYTNKYKGYAKGQPVRFCVGHAGKRPLVERFWENVEKSSGEGCWLWQGSMRSNGYGWISERGKSFQAHRVSYEIHKGLIPDGLFACHKCDNPRCVNPAHLFLGTQKDNVADMVAKGRGGKPPVYLGASNPNGKLTSKDVILIRSRVANGERKTVIAKEFGINVCHVYDIINHVVWKHV